jgi:hypothetical protein
MKTLLIKRINFLGEKKDSNELTMKYSFVYILIILTYTVALPI